MAKKLKRSKKIEEEDDEDEDTSNRYTGVVMIIDDELSVEADSNQYKLMRATGTIRKDNGKPGKRAIAYYVCPEHLLEELYDLKRKEWAVAGKDKTFRGFLDACERSQKFVKDFAEGKLANPYRK